MCADRNVVMLFTVGHEVRQYRSWTKNYTEAVVSGRRADGLDVDPLRRLMFWTDTHLHRINRAVVPKDSDVTTLPQRLPLSGVSRPEDVAVDWVAACVQTFCCLTALLSGSLGEGQEGDTDRQKPKERQTHRPLETDNYKQVRKTNTKTGAQMDQKDRHGQTLKHRREKHL